MQVSDVRKCLTRHLRPLRRRLDISLCRFRLRGLPVDQSLTDVVEFAFRERAICAQQVYSELTAFANLVAERRPQTIVEIGTSRGGTLFVLCRLAAPTSTIISVDMPGAGWGEAYTAGHVDLFKRFPVRGQTLHIVSGDSHGEETRRQVKDLLECKAIDLLFIDGDHSYEGVKKDFDMYSSLVADSGLIVFHDIAESTRFPTCEVRRLWNELKGKYRYREIVEKSDQGWGGIGVLTKGEDDMADSRMPE